MFCNTDRTACPSVNLVVMRNKTLPCNASSRIQPRTFRTLISRSKKYSVIPMRNYLWLTVVVLVVLTCLGISQVSAQWYYNGNYYTTCLPGPGSSIQCSGNLLRNPNGCTVLGFLVGNWVNDPTIIVPTATQYYTLQNLPSSIPPIGSWVTVTGYLYQGPNHSPTGASCPGNYINVTSIT